MTRFDDRLHDEQARSLAGAIGVIRSEWALHGMAVLVVMIVLTIAGAVVLATGEFMTRWSALAGSARLTVLLDPQLPRSDAERLKPAIEAVPHVTAVTFKTREDALARIASAGLPAIQTHPNPLPDAWSVSVAPVSPGEGPGEITSQRARIDGLKAALVKLPGVESVQSDTAWIAWIDRWAPVAHDAIAAVVGIAFGLAAFTAFGTWFLVGRAAVARGAGRPAAALVGLLGGAVGAIGAAAIVWLVAVAAGWSFPPWTTGRGFRWLDVGPALCLLTASAWAACATGCAVGHRKQAVTIDPIDRR